MQLNKTQREAIRKAAIKKVYAAQYEELKTNLRKVLGDAYATIYASQIKLSKKMPQEWVMKKSEFEVRIVDDEGPKTLYRVASEIIGDNATFRSRYQGLDKAYPCWIDYGTPRFDLPADSSHAAEVRDIQSKQRDLVKEIQQFHDETTSVLASCRTHRQLEESAPELYALLPSSLVKKPSTAVVPTSAIESVAEKLRGAA